MRKVLWLMVMMLLAVVVFAEEGHVHTEECDCEKSLEKDVTISDETIVEIHDHEWFEMRIAELTEYLDLLYEKVSEVDVNFREFQELVIESLDSIGEVKLSLDILSLDVLKIFETLGELETKLGEVAASSLMQAEFTSSLGELLESLSARLNLHELDVVNIFEALSRKVEYDEFEPFKDTVNVLTEHLSVLSESVLGIYSKFDDLEGSYRTELAAMKMTLDNLVTKDELAALEQRLIHKFEESNRATLAVSTEVGNELSQIKSELDELRRSFGHLVETTQRKFSEQDKEILIILSTIQRIWEEVQRLSMKVSTLETLFKEVKTSAGAK